MPNTGKYHIYISFDDGRDEGAVAGQKGQKTYGEKTAQSLEKGVKGLVSFEALKSTATQLIGHSIGTVELRTGAREYEQRQQFLFDRINEGVNTGAMLAIGAATGNLPLALIGAATSAISKLTNILMRAHTLNLEQTIEDTSIRLQSIRAGAGSRRSGTQ